MRGLTEVTVQLNEQTKQLPLYVVKGDHPSLLGHAWLEKIQLDWPSVHLLTNEGKGIASILKKHAKLFDGSLGSMKDITVKLSVKADSKPKFLKARPVPYAIRPKVEADLDALVKNGVLVPVSGSEWATPIVPILKKDGSVRLCGDFKVTVNPVLSVEQYPLPHMEDLFATLAGGKKFSKVDLSQAYLQMHVDEQSRKILTVTTHKGQFRYCRLPFGITSAPAIFQRAMDQILSGLKGDQCYLDDVLVTGSNDEEHLQILDATLQSLRDYGLKKFAKTNATSSSLQLNTLDM